MIDKVCISHCFWVLLWAMRQEWKENIFYKGYNRENIDRNESMRPIYNFGLEYPSVNNC